MGSDHDGEVLAAARQAEKIRKKVGVTWDELLVPPTRQRSKHPPPEELMDWRLACHFCLERYWLLTSWELDFVATVVMSTGAFRPPFPSRDQGEMSRYL